MLFVGVAQGLGGVDHPGALALGLFEDEGGMESQGANQIALCAGPLPGKGDNPKFLAI